MRISVPQDRDRFWTSPLSQGRPNPERSPQETGLLETSAAKPRDTAVTESVVERPDALRLRFEPRLRMGKDRRRIPAEFHRDHLARKLSVPLFVFSGGNLLPNCARSRIAMDQTAAARCTGCPVAAREPRSPVQGPQHNLASRSEEHTSELQSQSNLVCRLLLEKKKATTKETNTDGLVQRGSPTRTAKRHP